MATLRQRLLRALQIDAIAPGDRLPGTRELASEYSVDPRVVADAYRELALEGLVELRPRSGVFVHSLLGTGRAGRPISAAWLAEIFTAGLTRGISASELPTVLRRALGKARLPVVVIATTIDQTAGICRELEQYVGVSSSGVLVESLPMLPASASSAESRLGVPRAVLRARLLVTTEAHASRVATLAARLKRPSIAVSVRRELYEIEWALLKGVEAYVLVVDPRFGALVTEYLRAKRAWTPVHILQAGRDDLSRIPPDAPVYATQAARERLGKLRLPPGLLHPARILSDDCLQAILQHVIELARAEERRS
ncbi:MAG: winged helix-turn-helix domain-containing protein [Gemmatimonadaceae bacterium]